MQMKGETVALSESWHPFGWTSLFSSQSRFILFPKRGQEGIKRKFHPRACALSSLLPLTVGMKSSCSCLRPARPCCWWGLWSSSPLSSALPSQPHHFSLHKHFWNSAHLHTTLSTPSSRLPFLCSTCDDSSLSWSSAPVSPASLLKPLQSGFTPQHFTRIALSSRSAEDSQVWDPGLPSVFISTRVDPSLLWKQCPLPLVSRAPGAWLPRPPSPLPRPLLLSVFCLLLLILSPSERGGRFSLHLSPWWARPSPCSGGIWVPPSLRFTSRPTSTPTFTSGHQPSCPGPSPLLRLGPRAPSLGWPSPHSLTWQLCRCLSFSVRASWTGSSFCLPSFLVLSRSDHHQAYFPSYFLIY